MRQPLSTVSPLIRLTPQGLYCAAGDFFIDPSMAVDRAVLTHAHSDHAVPGSRAYLVSAAGEEVYRIRLGNDAQLETLPYGEQRTINGVTVSLHPAGHILGSAQVRIEYRGEVWVVSGDYKLTKDPTCDSFEAVRCHTFITEATFALPIYRWPDETEVMSEIKGWWRRNRERNRASLLTAYALGKAQRILAGLGADSNAALEPIFTHGSVERLNEAYRRSGVQLPVTRYVGDVKNKSEFSGALIIAPPSAEKSMWTRRFGVHSAAFASGWMMVRGARRRRALDSGFVLSDHADWPGLLQAIEATGADRILVTHGYINELVRWLREKGRNAWALRIAHFGDEAEAEEPAESLMSEE